MKRRSTIGLIFPSVFILTSKRNIPVTLSGSILIFQANGNSPKWWDQSGASTVYSLSKVNTLRCAEEDFWRGKEFANQCVGQHVTEYFWPVGCGSALIKGEYSVWKSHLAQGSRTSWRQNDLAAVRLISGRLGELVDSPDQDFSNSVISNRPTLHHSPPHPRSDGVPDSLLWLSVQDWNVELRDLRQLAFDCSLETQHLLLEQIDMLLLEGCYF